MGHQPDAGAVGEQLDGADHDRDEDLGVALMFRDPGPVRVPPPGGDLPDQLDRRSEMATDRAGTAGDDLGEPGDSGEMHAAPLVTRRQPVSNTGGQSVSVMWVVRAGVAGGRRAVPRR